MQHKAKLTQGPVAKTLIRLSLPMFVAMTAMVGLNIIDTFYIGQLGTEQLAAMGFTLAVILAVNSVSMGLGVGTTAVIANSIGRGETGRSRRLATDAILLGLLVASTIAATGLSFIDPLFRLLGAEGIVLEYIHQYMMVWFIGVPIIVIPQTGNSGIRATGDTKTPAKIMLSVLVVNALLDPLLIFGLGPVPAFGLQGAAMATVTAQGLAMCISLTVLLKRRIITFEKHSFSALFDSWKHILKIGVPAGITQLITPISVGIITSIVATYGVAAVAGFGVSARLEMFAVMLVMAIGVALVPFVAQNWGAGNKERVASAVRVATIMAVSWTAIVWVLSLLFGRSIAGVFNDNPEVIEVVINYMAIVFPSLMLMATLLTVTNALNALHKPVHSMLLSMLRMFVLYVPLAFAGSALFGLTGVWWAAASANALGGIIAWLWFHRVFGKMEPLPMNTEEVAEDSRVEVADATGGTVEPATA